MADTQDVSRATLIRDLVIFQVKLVLDGLKDVVLSPLSAGAGFLAILAGGDSRWARMFYRVMRVGERYDLWLNLFGAVRRDDVDGLFGGSRAGSPTLLGELEELIRGGDEPRRKRKPPAE